MTEKKKPEIVFMPGCFDSFDGTQEELDELIKTIQEMVENPDEMLANSREVDLEEVDDEFLESIAKQLGVENTEVRKLH